MKMIRKVLTEWKGSTYGRTFEASLEVSSGIALQAIHLIKNLLQNGYTTHATLRDLENQAKTSHLLSLPRVEERLKLFKANLSEEGSFDSAITGCEGIFQVATPLEFDSNPEDGLLHPAVKGVVNVLRAYTKAGTVKQLVCTSLVTAACPLINDMDEYSECLNKSCWTAVDLIINKKPPGWIEHVESAQESKVVNKEAMTAALPWRSIGECHEKSSASESKGTKTKMSSSKSQTTATSSGRRRALVEPETGKAPNPFDFSAIRVMHDEFFIKDFMQFTRVALLISGGDNNFMEKRKEILIKLVIGAILQSTSEDRSPRVDVHVPARMEYSGRNSFVFHLEDNGN
eukprot:Gb_36568 [translate_table: standard]